MHLKQRLDHETHSPTIRIEESSYMRPSDKEIDCIVSIETGVLISRDIERTIKPLFDKLTEMTIDTEKLA